MAIRTVVTRGYGNGTFNGTIPLVVTRGYTSLTGATPPTAMPLMVDIGVSVATNIVRLANTANQVDADPSKNSIELA